MCSEKCFNEISDDLIILALYIAFFRLFPSFPSVSPFLPSLCLLNSPPQLSPRFPYVHTLLGHEYVMLKDFEKAMSSFQTAVSLDPRHYNAWYTCYMYYIYKNTEYLGLGLGLALGLYV